MTHIQLGRLRVCHPMTFVRFFQGVHQQNLLEFCGGRRRSSVIRGSKVPAISFLLDRIGVYSQTASLAIMVVVPVTCVRHPGVTVFSLPMET
jgi:hypothetical protein